MKVRRPPRPPRLAERLLRLVISDEHAREAVLGDLQEDYAGRASRSATLARMWYWLAAAAMVGWYLWARLRDALRAWRAKPKGDSSMHRLWSDARFALRSMRRTPIFSATAIVTLALGVGGTTAIFSVVNAVLLKPLPFEDSDQLVAVWHTAPGMGAEAMPMSPATYFTYLDESRTFDIGLWDHARVTVTGVAEPERVNAMLVTEGILPLLRVSPILGRGYTTEDASPGSEYPVILAYGYWQRRFAGDPGVIGRTMHLNGAEVEIVGVMGQRLRFDAFDPAIYLPLVYDRSRARLGNYSYQGIARLRPGATIEAANRDAARMNPLARERYPGKTQAEFDAMGFGTVVRPLKESLVGNTVTLLWVLFGAVGLVLLIACANVANLFLVRAESRQRDVAVRKALGASRGQVARQFLAESLLLGTLGGAAGLGLAYAGLRLLVRIAPENLPRLDEISIDATVLLFALGLSLAAGLLFGLFPVFNYGRTNLVAALKEGGRSSSDGRQRYRLRNVLAVSQVALALVLLIGSGLMIRSFQALRNVKPGFERPEEVLTLRLSIPRSAAPEREDAARVHERIIERLAEIPGVTSVSAAASVGMDRWDGNDGIHVEEFPVPEGEVEPVRRLNWVAADYFATIRNPVLAGRSIDWDDIHQRRPVAVVTENFARLYWGEPSRALGKRISTGRAGPWREIVGVVGNVHVKGVREDPTFLVYWPMVVVEDDGDVFAWRGMRYAIRSERRTPQSLMPEVRQAVWSINPVLPLASVQTLAEILARSMARTSFTLVMLAIAAAVALLLGAVGIYGVISYIVGQRTREIGVRMALGARREDVSRLVLRRGGLVAAVGIAIGLAAAVGLTRLMSAMLFGVSPLDPVTYAAVSVVLAGIALLATYIPARRAASVDPVEALRWE